jgi:hypothetical protein
MVTQTEFYNFALDLPESDQGSHFDVTDFRVKGRIFATLRESDGRAVLKLSPDQQQLLMTTTPGMFEPVKGGWGAKGWTHVLLSQADEATVRHALRMAWKSVAPKKLAGLAGSA